MEQRQLPNRRVGLYTSGSVQCDGKFSLAVNTSEKNAGCQAHFYVTGQLDTRPSPVASVEVQVKGPLQHQHLVRRVCSAEGGHGISKLPETKVG